MFVCCHGVEAPDVNPTIRETTKLRLKAGRSELLGRRHAGQAHSQHYVHGEVPRHAVSTVRCRPLGHRRWLATRLTLAEKPVVGASDLIALPMFSGDVLARPRVRISPSRLGFVLPTIRLWRPAGNSGAALQPDGIPTRSRARTDGRRCDGAALK